MRVTILGAGLIGTPMAKDLAADNAFKIRLVDQNSAKLQAINGVPKIEKETCDVTELQALHKVIEDADLVINALPGFLGFKILRQLIEWEKSVVDIAFFPEDPLSLREIAQHKKVTVLVDCGVAPGMSNLLVGYAQSLLGKLDKVKIYVGGLPRVRQLPWEYKAVFSPVDVIEEYTRPARFKQNGQIVIKEPLSEPELIDFPKIGTLEAFNSDGLRTLLQTMDVPEMVEKTLRYPGHREKILFLKEIGLLDQQAVRINGTNVRPIDLVAHKLFEQWRFAPGDEDLTVMRVDAWHGTKGIRFDLFDVYDAKTGIHSMARTTGFTATVMARALLNGLISENGVFPLELLGSNKPLVQFVFDELAKRGVHYQQITL